MPVAPNPTPYTTVGDKEQFQVLNGIKQFAAFHPFLKVYHDLPVGSRVLFPGAFNPWHEDHDRIAAKAHEMTGQPVDLEVTVRNVDKPALNYTDLQTRLTTCVSASVNKPWMGYVLLTGTPTFVDKIRAFPGSTFVVGWDTFRRIADPKYGNVQDVLNTLHQCNARFLVFHRIVNGKSTHENGDFIPVSLMNLARIIPPDELPPTDHNSTDIRRRG
jgi:nicotinic acid mononucleotide adenylyltransferase